MFAKPIKFFDRVMDYMVIPTTGWKTDFAGIPTSELLRAMIRSLQTAWERIYQILEGVRDESLGKIEFKSGADFFTIADTTSERIIKDVFLCSFHTKDIRIFGEEANCYLGNEKALVGIRIDPIDGTRAMKFSRFKWGILVGVYHGTPEKEAQIMSACFFPELIHRPLMIYLQGEGTFVMRMDKTGYRLPMKVAQSSRQNDLGNIVVTFWKHTDFSQRGRVNQIEDEIAKANGHPLSTDSGAVDVLEACLTGGQRAMIIDGDYSLVDFIPHPAITSLGYQIYKWDGTLMRPEDPALVNAKLAIVPPGQAGEQILEIVSRYA